MSPDRAPQLNYAATTPRRGRRLLRLLAVAAVLLVAAAWAARLGQEGLRRWQWKRLYARCANFSAPADQVAYEQDPAAAATLLARADYVALPALARPEKPAAGRAVPRWDALRRGAGLPPSAGGDAVLFLHRLTSGPTQCFVRVAATGVSQGVPIAFLVHHTDIRPDGGFDGSSPGADYDEVFPVPFVAGVKDRSLRFYAGQADPADPSHFTIVYEMTGGRGTIDGWLRGSDISVHLKVRDGPAASTQGD
jgi:hypothetical protein